MQRVFIPFSAIQSLIACAMNSGPLSERINSGAPRLLHQALQNIDDITGCDAVFHFQCQTLAGVFIQNWQPLQPPLLAGLGRHLQPLLFPEPMDAFDVHLPTLAPQMPRHATIARTGLAPGNALHCLDQTGIGTGASSLVSLGASGLSKARTGPALARFQTVLDMLDRLTFACRDQPFGFTQLLDDFLWCVSFLFHESPCGAPRRQLS